MHRSTLKYRLQRIRELTGFDLGNPETHFNLQLATRAYVTLQALAILRPEPAAYLEPGASAADLRSSWACQDEAPCAAPP